MYQNPSLIRTSLLVAIVAVSACGKRVFPVDMSSAEKDDSTTSLDAIDTETCPADPDATDDTLDVLEQTDTGGAGAIDAWESIDGSCEGETVDQSEVGVGVACETVGESLCAQAPRSLQGSISIGATTGIVECLPTDRYACQDSPSGPKWQLFQCNDAGPDHPCLALPKGFVNDTPWTIKQGGSGCREVNGHAICCPSMLHAGNDTSELGIVASCPAAEANARVCSSDGNHIRVCHVMPSFEPPDTLSIPTTTMPSSNLSALQPCADMLPGCTYFVSWYRDATKGKLICDTPGTIPPKKVSVVPRCIMDNGQARWAKTCDEHFNGVPDP